MNNTACVGGRFIGRGNTADSISSNSISHDNAPDSISVKSVAKCGGAFNCPHCVSVQHTGGTNNTYRIAVNAVNACNISACVGGCSIGPVDDLERICR